MAILNTWSDKFGQILFPEEYEKPTEKEKD